MAVAILPCRELYTRALTHLLNRIDATPAVDEPFSHIFLENVFPDDMYAHLLRALPSPELYSNAAERHSDGEGNYNRAMFHLTPENMARLPGEQRELFQAVAAVLTSAELKEAMFAKLAKDLAYRYGVPESEARNLEGYSRPTLFRETEGFEIKPHPDTRRKVVTMHLYWPADHSQLGLGTGLYRRRVLAWPFGTWHHRFEKVKQFPFKPNSGYAFVVNNTLSKKSWHGREKLPAGAGVRNTLLNTFYETPRDGFGKYLD